MHAFTDYSGLTSATIGNSMTSIGRLSFSDCDDPTSATIGNIMTKLVDAAYYTPRHILQYQPTFNIVRYIPLRHVQQKNRFEIYGQEPSWGLRIWNCQNEMPQIREFWRIFVSSWISTHYTFNVSSVQEMGAKTPAPRGRKLRVDAIRS